MHTHIKKKEVGRKNKTTLKQKVMGLKTKQNSELNPGVDLFLNAEF